MTIFKYQIGLLVGLMLIQWNASANVTLEEQRKLFVQAESVANSPKSRTYKRLMDKLDGYPLKPYIEYKTLSNFAYLSNKKAIQTFLEDYRYSPMDRPLRKKWLNYLAKKGENRLFEQSYRDIGDTALTCIHANNLLKDPKTKAQGLAIAERLWVVGRSQPKACDPVFKVWQQAGLRTPQHVWDRLSLAANGGNHTLIPYLKTLLSDEKKYLADLWLRIRRSPSQVSRISHFPGKFPELETQILTYGLKRLAWRDRDLALRSWERQSARFQFSPAQLEQIAHRFAISLALKNHPKATYWLQKANQLNPDSELIRWHLAHTLREFNWQGAIDVLDSVPRSVTQDNVFQYWRARAFEQLSASTLAQEGYENLAKNRHYYGFLASGKLQQAPKLNNAPIQVTPEELTKIAQNPATQRAMEFRQLNRPVSARREWNFLQSQLNSVDKATAAVFADQQGWHEQAIFGFSKAGYLNDIQKRFPMPFKAEIIRYAKHYQIDPAWAFSIARRESSFMPDAASGAGALGLMQVLPSTAKYLAKKPVSRKTLFNPEQNLKFGTQYLRYLMDKMDNNQILATASYNAGWRNVKNWLPKDQALPADLWIETIPFKETRNYVQAILAYKYIYNYQLGKPNNDFTELTQTTLKRP